jgi:hypothetical protein
MKQLTELFAEIEQFLQSYGDIIEPGQARLARYDIGYGLSDEGIRFDVKAGNLPSGFVGAKHKESATLQEFRQAFYLHVGGLLIACRRPIPLRNELIDSSFISPHLEVFSDGGVVAVIERSGHYFDTTADPVGVRLVCEHLMGYDTPLMDWLTDEYDLK